MKKNSTLKENILFVFSIIYAQLVWLFGHLWLNNQHLEFLAIICCVNIIYGG